MSQATNACSGGRPACRGCPLRAPKQRKAVILMRSKQDLPLVYLNCVDSLWPCSKLKPFMRLKHLVTLWRGSKPQPFKLRRLAFTGGSCVGAVSRSSALRLIPGQSLAHFVRFGQVHRGALLREPISLGDSSCSPRFRLPSSATGGGRLRAPEPPRSNALFTRGLRAGIPNDMGFRRRSRISRQSPAGPPIDDYLPLPRRG